MRNLSVIIILIIASFSFSQEKKFNIGINLFPNYCLGIISNDGTASNASQTFYKEIEIGKFCFNYSVQLEYELSQKSSIGIGLGYQNNGERNKKTSLYFPQTTEDSPTHLRTVYNRHNVEIPIHYKLKFGEKFYLQVGSSVFINILNYNKTIQYFSDSFRETSGSKDQTTDYRRVNFSGNLGFGYNYSQQEKYTLYLQPYSQISILGVAKNAPLNRNFLAVGLSTGIRF